MTKDSSYRGGNYRTSTALQAVCPDQLEARYREIKELREQVRDAEASALKRGMRD